MPKTCTRGRNEMPLALGGMRKEKQGLPEHHANDVCFEKAVRTDRWHILTRNQLVEKS